MQSSSEFVRLPGGPFAVECCLVLDFYDGPVGGFLRSPSLGRALGTAADFVWSSASKQFWTRSWHRRDFILAAAPEDACERIAERNQTTAAEHWIECWSPDLSFERGIAQLWREFQADPDSERPPAQGLACFRFDESYAAVHVWQLAGGGVLVQGDIPMDLVI